jgi:hypothetical protein
VSTEAVYLLSAVGLTKIGHSVRVEQRIGELRTASPVELTVEAVLVGAGPDVEGYLHDRLRRMRRHGEWFALPDGATETIAAWFECIGSERDFTVALAVLGSIEGVDFTRPKAHERRRRERFCRSRYVVVPEQLRFLAGDASDAPASALTTTTGRGA